MPDQENVASSIGEPPSKGGMCIRGYSDSVVPSCLASQENKLEHGNLAGLANKDRASASTVQGTGLLLPQHVKARLNLHLPSFKSLGIASRLPNALLTPPDENISEFEKPAPLSCFNRSSSFPPSMPKTPSPDITDLSSNMSNMLSLTAATNNTHAATPAAPTEVNKSDQDGTGPLSPSGEEDPVMDSDHPGWIAEALEAVGTSSCA